MHFDDHINPESARAGARIAELYAKYGIKGDFYPIGLSLQMMLKLAPEVPKTLKRLEMPISYHGVTHYRFQVMQERIGDKDWDEAVEEAIYCETHRLNPFKAVIEDSEPGGVGLLTEVFGYPPILQIPRILITGRSGSGLYALKKLGAKMLIAESGNMLAWPLYWNLGMLQGREGEGDYGITVTLSVNRTEFMAPEPQSGDITLFEDPIDIIQNLIDHASRDQVTMITAGGHPFNFTIDNRKTYWGGKMYRGVRTPADLPDHYIPSDNLLTQEQTDAILAEYERMVKFVAEHPELTVVTVNDILDMVEPLPKSRSVSRNVVAAITEEIIKLWIIYPPEFISIGKDHFSLADVFQALAFSLDYYSTNGSLPDKVTIREILGPTDTPITVGAIPLSPRGFPYPQTLLTGEEVLRMVGAIAPEITDRIPSVINVYEKKVWDHQQFLAQSQAAHAGDAQAKAALAEGTGNTNEIKSILNPGEFLYIMAQVYLNIYRKNNPGKALVIPGTMVPGGAAVEQTVPKQEWHWWMQRWTIKPATLKPEYQWLLE